MTPVSSTIVFMTSNHHIRGEPLQLFVTAEEQIAAQFVAARAAGEALTGFPGVIPATLADAYRVQDLAITQMSAPIGGWKVGRIFSPLAEKYDCNRLAGPILKRAIHVANAGERPTAFVYTGGFGAVEAEFLFRVGTPPPARQRRFSLEDAAAAIDCVHVGIEIASSPLATINELGPPVIITDFGNNNGLIVGPEIVDWRTNGFEHWDVVTAIDGLEVGRGAAYAFPDGPLGSVRFLLELLVERNIAVEKGTWISSGAISGVHDIRAGQHAEAQFGPDLQVACTLASVVRASSSA